MKKNLLLFGLFTLFFFTLFALQQTSYAAQKQGQLCQGAGQGNCSTGLYCVAPNPYPLAACAKNPSSTLCQNHCEPPQPNQTCKGTGRGNCAPGLICVPVPFNPQCAKPSLRNSPECQGRCQIPPQVRKGGVCKGTGQSDCLKGLTCQNGTCQPSPSSGGQQGDTCTGTNGLRGTCADGCLCMGAPVNCLHLGACNGHCDCTEPTPTDTPPPPPPSPPCKKWVKGQCQTMYTGLGGLATSPQGFITSIFAILLSFSGGIALLLIIRAGYQLMTSQGKPEQIQQGRDQLIAAIVGLVFLILSFVILQTIGFDILRIPAFGQ